MDPTVLVSGSYINYQSPYIEKHPFLRSRSYHPVNALLPLSWHSETAPPMVPIRNIQSKPRSTYSGLQIKGLVGWR